MIALPTLALFNLNPMELIVVGILGILLFGRRLPEIGKSLGKSIVEFKKGLSNTSDDINKTIDEPASASASASGGTRRVEARPVNRPTKQIASTSDEP